MQKTHAPDGLLGLEFGSSAIKLIELSTTESGYRLESMAAAPLPEDAIVEHSILDEEAVLNAVKQAIEISRTSVRKFSILFRGGHYDIRWRIVPRMSEHELNASIGTLIDETFPWDMTDRLFNYRIEKSDESDQMKVIAISFPKVDVEKMVLVARSAGLEAKYLASESSCLGIAGWNRGMAAATSRGLEGRRPVDMLLRLGGAEYHFVIFADGYLLYYHWGAYAGHLLTEEIMQAHSCSDEEAERIKIENFSSIEPAALNIFHDKVIKHIKRDIAMFHHQNPRYSVRTLHLSGGCTQIPGIVEVLQKNLEVNVVLANPFEHIEIPDDKFDRDEAMRIAPMMVTAIGSTLIHDIELHPDDRNITNE